MRLEGGNPGLRLIHPSASWGVFLIGLLQLNEVGLLDLLAIVFQIIA